MLSKWCPHCQRLRPWSEFQAAARDENGDMIRPGAYCKPCLAARKRARRKIDPEWAKQTDRADWQRIKANPEKLARRRELTRENGTVYRVRRGRP